MSENQIVEKSITYEVAGEEIKLSPSIVKNYLTRGNSNINNQEVVQFINICKHNRLNPFLNEAYLIKFGQQPAQMIVGKEAYMKRAENHPKFAGMRAGVIIQRGDELLELEGTFTLKGDILLGGWAEVYRDDRKYPYTIKVSMSEFSKNQSTWKSMPCTMIRKVAIVQALREAFPSNLGGMYVEDEVENIPPQNQQQDVKYVEKEVEQEVEEKANIKEINFNEVQQESEKKVEQIEVEIIEEDKKDDGDCPW